MQKATQQQTKEHNRNLVLRTISLHASISRAEIARVTRLTRTTVSDIVAELMDAGLVEEIGLGESLGGKSPILLSLIEDSRCLIGLNLAQNQYSGAVVNLRGKVRELVTVPIHNGTAESSLAALYELLDRLMQSPYRPVVGIGVGTAGLVNTRDGVVVNAVNLDWKNLPLAGLLQNRYHLPVSVLNDSQAAALGEYVYGKRYAGDDNLIVINVSHGIGSGILINGQLFQGDGGGAGEIGHVEMVREGGRPCRCGNHGCLETVASAGAVIARVCGQSAGPREETNLEVVEASFAAGDPLAREAVFEAGRYLGMAISSLVGTLNIEKIVLTGEMTRFGRPWLDVVRETAARKALFSLAQNTQIEIGRLDHNGIILGAAALLLKDYSALFPSDGN